VITYNLSEKLNNLT